MVRGIKKFREAFSAYSGNYVIIGGSACEVHEENAGQTPRATKDIDIILIVEALSHDFAARFWQFVSEAGYTEKQIGEKGAEPRHQYYRFKNPSNSSYPAQIELFAEWRKANKSWLRYSQHIAMKMLDCMEELGLSQRALAEKMRSSQQYIPKY